MPRTVYEYTKKITADEIDDIMCGALEGGITYWCVAAKDISFKATTTHKWAHETLTHGGALDLTDDDGKVHRLTIGKLLDGLALYGHSNYDEFDASDYDNIVQLALFGEIIYG